MYMIEYQKKLAGFVIIQLCGTLKVMFRRSASVKISGD
jgi:hypothetical protein